VTRQGVGLPTHGSTERERETVFYGACTWVLGPIQPLLHQLPKRRVVLSHSGTSHSLPIYDARVVQTQRNAAFSSVSMHVDRTDGPLSFPTS
jgi:hypothetical protein